MAGNWNEPQGRVGGRFRGCRDMFCVSVDRSKGAYFSLETSFAFYG